MKKKIILIAALLALICNVSGCMALTRCTEITQEELTEEAAAAFEELSGENGIMLYLDPEQNSKLMVTMYAVLYGESGQTLHANHSGSKLYLKVSGTAGEGYTVWRVSYSPLAVERLEFRRDSDTLTMDGYEELTFTVEQSRAEDTEK